MIEPFAVFEIANDVGVHLGLCRLPGRLGDLDGDALTMAAWHPALVISMTEAKEMAEARIGNLPATLGALGIAHAAFPIRDFGVPEHADTRWPEISRQAHTIFDQGGSILLHCMGGRGRSGMVALRLLTERGMSPAAALAAIRTARPGAIETAAQERWGSEGIPISQVSSSAPH